MTAKIAVIIVNFNSGSMLEECLRHVRAQTCPPARLIVVDNASHDGSVDEFEENYPDVDLVRLDQNLGFAVANNVAALRAEGMDWLALLNPDAFPESTWLERLLAAALDHPECASFAARLVDAKDSERLDGTGDIYHGGGLARRRDHGCLAASVSRPAGEVFAPSGAAALYRRSAFLEVGGFDESYFCYFEDVDLGFRLRLAGYGCHYAPDAIVRHIGSAITGRGSAFSRYYGHRNLVWTWWKNMPGPLFWLYLPQHLALNLGSIAWFMLRGQGAILLRAKWDALRGLPRCWHQRQHIQARRQISCGQLWRLLSHDLWSLYRSARG